MPDFYERMLSVSQDLISRRGRDVTYVKPRRTEFLIDSNRPWKGHSPPPPPIDDENPIPPITPPEEQLAFVMRTVVVPSNQVRIFGLAALGDALQFNDLVQNSEKLLIVCPGTLNVDDFYQVIDEGVTYGITANQVLRPANLTLLAYLGVRR